MAWKKQPRDITDHQFSDGSTIDGDRIDGALEDITRRFNKIPPGDLKKRYVQSQIIQGWTPQDISVTERHHLPWMEAKNEWYQRNWYNSVVVPTETDPNIQNPLRVKACSIPGTEHQNHFTLNPRSQQFVWASVMQVNDPIILRNWSLLLETTNVGMATTWYANGWTYGNPPPPGHVNAEMSQDLALIIDVDSPFQPENRSKAEVVWNRSRFVLLRDKFSSNPLPNSGGFTDLAPNPYPNGSPNGMACSFDLNIPIRAGARIRWSVVIPRYDGTLIGYGSWGSAPYHTFCVSSTLTLLEQIV